MFHSLVNQSLFSSLLMTNSAAVNKGDVWQTHGHICRSVLLLPPSPLSPPRHLHPPLWRVLRKVGVMEREEGVSRKERADGRCPQLSKGPRLLGRGREGLV